MLHEHKKYLASIAPSYECREEWGKVGLGMRAAAMSVEKSGKVFILSCDVLKVIASLSF